MTTKTKTDTKTNDSKIKEIKKLIKELREGGKELSELGNSHEKMKGYGILETLDEIENILK